MQLPFRWPSLQPPSPDGQSRLLTSGAVLPAGADSGRGFKRWLLSRALYRCKSLSLARVEAGDRRAVLRNLLLAWAPFEHAEYRVAWQADAVLAVAWDRSDVQRRLASAGAPANAVIQPETFLREPMSSDGVRVLQCLEGIEAQLWRGRSLRESRWWPREPDASEVQTWLRSLGGDSSEVSSLPEVAAVAWRRRPWAELQGFDELLSTTSRLERVVVGAALAGFAALTAAQAHRLVAAYEEREALQRESERARLEAAPVLAARDRAEALARESEALARQLTGVLPLEVLQHLADVLPAQGVTLKELDLSGLQLRLALELGAGLQRSAVVKDMQAGGWLTKVNEVRDNANRGWIVFESVLAGPRAPAASARPAVPASAPVSTRLPGAPSSSLSAPAPQR